MKEEQPALPGAEHVRDLEIPTPEFDLPFSLSSGPRLVKGAQTDLFASSDDPEPVLDSYLRAGHSLDAWVEDWKRWDARNPVDVLAR